MNNKKQIGWYFNSNGFVRAYRNNPDGSRTQIGSISNRVTDERFAQFHREMCAILGNNVTEWFGSYWVSTVNAASR